MNKGKVIESQNEKKGREKRGERERNAIKEGRK